MPFALSLVPLPLSLSFPSPPKQAPPLAPLLASLRTSYLLLEAKVAAAEATAEKAKKEHEEMKDELQFVRSTLLRKTKMLGQMMGEDKVPEFQERHAQTVAATTSEVGSQCVLAAVHAPRHSSADDDASSEDASAEGEAVAEAEAEGEAGITRRGRRSKTVGTLGGGDRRGAGDEGPGEGSEEGSGEGERAPSKRKDARSATWHSTTLGGKAVPKGMPVRRAPALALDALEEPFSEGLAAPARNPSGASSTP